MSRVPNRHRWVTRRQLERDMLLRREDGPGRVFAAEDAHPPPRPDRVLRDDRTGRPITLPRVSILELAE